MYTGGSHDVLMVDVDQIALRPVFDGRCFNPNPTTKVWMTTPLPPPQIALHDHP